MRVKLKIQQEMRVKLKLQGKKKRELQRERHPKIIKKRHKKKKIENLQRGENQESIFMQKESEIKSFFHEKLAFDIAGVQRILHYS